MARSAVSPAHVKRVPILGDSRHLAILTSVIAAQRDDEDVKSREIRHPRLPRPILCRQQISVNLGVAVRKKVVGLQVVIKRRMRLKAMIDEAGQFAPLQNLVIPCEVGDDVALGIKLQIASAAGDILRPETRQIVKRASSPGSWRALHRKFQRCIQCLADLWVAQGICRNRSVS